MPLNSFAEPEPSRRRWLRRIFLGTRYLWLLGDVAIIGIYCARHQSSDAPEAIALLTFLWTAPLGSLSLLGYGLLRPRAGFSLSGYALTVPGEVVLTWAIASIAGFVQYFVVLPRYFRGAAGPRSSWRRSALKQHWLDSAIVAISAMLSWILVRGFRLVLIGLDVGPIPRYLALRRRAPHMPVGTFMAALEPLRDEVSRLEMMVLWPLALGLIALLYTWLVRSPRLWHFAVLPLPAALIQGLPVELRTFSLYFVYSAWLVLLSTLLRRFWRHNVPPTATQGELPPA